MQHFSQMAYDQHATVNDAFRKIDARKAGTLDWSAPSRQPARPRRRRRTEPSHSAQC